MSARMEGLERLAKAAAKVVDDWGWKGGKPGEITGGEYAKYVPYFEENLHQRARKQALKAARQEKLPNVNTNKTYANTYERNLQDSQIAMTMHNFDALERADVPREWTGKILRAHGGELDSRAMSELGVPTTARKALSPTDVRNTRRVYAQKLSDILRPMTNDQRETFVSLLPEWDGSIDDLADVARNL